MLSVMLPDELKLLIDQLRIVGAEQQRVEAKPGVGKSVLETLSAFSNQGGGVILVGISEENGFTPIPGFDAHAARDALVSRCDQLTPAVRPDMEVVSFEGQSVLVAQVEELENLEKPCYITARGQYNGSYARTGDSDVKLTRYEVDRLIEQRTQPRWDLEPIQDASESDLDSGVLNAYLDEQRARRPKTFEDDLSAALTRLRILRDGSPTLAAILAMGDYPQQFFPRLTVTFALYPGTGKGDVIQGVRLLDSQRLNGAIPELVETGVRLVENNMRTAGLIDDVFRRDLPDYPRVAVREALVNALMHRDYSPAALGTSVQIDMFVDRLVITNPGGLYGGVTTQNLGDPGASSTRNQQLATFLEDLRYPTGGPVAENRGTGIAVMNRAATEALMPPPEFTNSLTHFSVTFWKRKVAVTEKHETAYQKVARLVEEKASWSTTELVRATDLSRTAVQRALNQLVADRIVEKTEPDRSPKQRYRLRK